MVLAWEVEAGPEKGRVRAKTATKEVDLLVIGFPERPLPQRIRHNPSRVKATARSDLSWYLLDRAAKSLRTRPEKR